MPTASSVLAERFWPAVPEHIWDSIREEFTLQPVSELEARFQSVGDPEARRRAVRVFIGEGTFCPGFQLKDGLIHEPLLRLFDQAMSLKIPQNVFPARDALASAQPPRYHLILLGPARSSTP